MYLIRDTLWFCWQETLGPEEKVIEFTYKNGPAKPSGMRGEKITGCKCVQLPSEKRIAKIEQLVFNPRIKNCRISGCKSSC